MQGIHKQSIRWAQAIIGLVLPVLFTGPIHADGMTIKLYEKDEPEFGKIIQRITVTDLLSQDENGQPALNLSPEQNPEHRAFLELLKPGMPIDKKPVQDQIAKILSEFPEPCHDTLLIRTVVGPIAYVDKWVPGVTDKRRIYSMGVSQCLETTPSQCSTCLCETGGFDFGLNSLSGFLRDCHEAIHQDIKAGKPFHAKVLERQQNKFLTNE